MIAQLPFLQALGFALINSLWQYSFLWLCYALFSLYNYNATRKYLLAIVLQFLGFGWFLVTFIYFYIQPNQIATYTNIFTQFEPAFWGTSSLKILVLNTVSQGEKLLPYLSILYLVLLSRLCLQYLKCYQNTQLLRAKGIAKPSIELKLFINKTAFHFGIKRIVQVSLSSTITTPLTIGFYKPIILLPIAILNNLSTQQIEAVLIHELAHIKRQDYFINLLVSVVETVLFFNPFVKLLCKQIKKERENCCDDQVLNYKYNVNLYASALLVIARYNNKMQNNFIMAAADSNYTLLHRVKRMIEVQHHKPNYKQQLIALLFLISSISSLFVFVQVKQFDRNFAASKVVIKKTDLGSLSTHTTPLSNASFTLIDDAGKKALREKTSARRRDNKHYSIKNNIAKKLSKSTEAYQQKDILDDVEAAASIGNGSEIANLSAPSVDQQIVDYLIVPEVPVIPTYIQISADVPDEILPTLPIAEHWSYSYNGKPRVIILPNVSPMFTIPSETSVRSDIQPLQILKSPTKLDETLKKKALKFKKKIVIRI